MGSSLRRILLFGLLLSLLAGVFLASTSSGAPPPIRGADDITVEATSSAGATVTYHIKAYDPNTTNPISATCTPGGTGSGDFDLTADFPLGSTPVHCDATLENGDTASADFTVTVQDTQPPSFGTVSDVTDSTTNPAGKAVTYTSPVATDVVDGPITASCNPASGSTFPIGTTAVHCSATDSHGNSATADFNVVVTLIDDQAPTITVPNSMTVEATEPGGAVVTYSVSANDNADPSPTSSCSPQSGSTFPLGTTSVTCTATDAAGNTSTPGTFDVTVVDTTAPSLSVPGDQTVETSSPGGATVSYTATASDAVAGAISPSCVPASGTTFPLGSTTVNCSADDGHGNTAHASFTVTVVLADHDPPVLTGVPADRTVEANGPNGSVVTFSTPTANDAVDGPIAGVTCAPASGSTFPLGTTTVTCSATDAHGNTGTASFTVTVRDTTKPRLIVPGDRDVYADTPSGIDSQSDTVASFLSGARAVDTVDPRPSVTNDAPSFLTVGPHVVTFTARDASGNSVSQTANLGVLPMPPLGTPSLPVPPARKPPPDVRALKADAGDKLVRLNWQTPSGVDHVFVTRSLTTGGDEQVVYTGSGEVFTDRGVTNGLEYRYLVVSVDADGNESAGIAVVALPKLSLLRSPKDGARLRRPPKLVWFADAGASYYNVQLYRGNVKILSAWPVKATLVLHTNWKFSSRRYTLAPGVYRWYVWPGFGARNAVDYGDMLGFSSFTFVR